jgi:hypothetical protein
LFRADIPGFTSTPLKPEWCQQPVVGAGPFDLVTALDVFGHMLNAEVDGLLHFILNESGTRLFLVTNRRDATSQDYLKREKTRHEGIDLTSHTRFS